MSAPSGTLLTSLQQLHRQNLPRQLTAPLVTLAIKKNIDENPIARAVHSGKTSFADSVRGIVDINTHLRLIGRDHSNSETFRETMAEVGKQMEGILPLSTNEDGILYDLTKPLRPSPREKIQEIIVRYLISLPLLSIIGWWVYRFMTQKDPSLSLQNAFLLSVSAGVLFGIIEWARFGIHLERRRRFAEEVLANAHFLDKFFAAYKEGQMGTELQ